MSSLSKCVVCTDPESEDNKVLRCIVCNVRVHQLCYGVETYKEQWKCSPCMVKTSGSDEPICELCLQYGGAFKKTSNGKWSHVICGLFIEGVRFGNKQKMEPINISKIPDECRNKLCEFCLNNDGVSCLCSDSDCDRWVHVTCAQQNACTKEITDEKGMITFLVYCENHMPSHRRISSVFVRDKLNEKCNEIQRHQEEPTTIHESSESDSEQSTDEDDVNNSSGSQNVSGDVHQSISSCETLTSNASTSQNRSGNSSNLSNESIASNTNTVSDFSNGSGLSIAIGGIDNTINPNDAGSIDGTGSDNTNDVSHPIDINTFEDIEQNSDILNAPQYWWDGHDLLVELHSKDKKIAKLKEKKTKLKDQMNDLRDENSNLQMQIQELTAKLQNGLMLTKHENMNASCSTVSNQTDDIIEILETRTATRMSNDGSKLIFPNGVKVKADLARRLEIIPSEESSDRKFVNESFEIFFSDKYIEKQIRSGCAKEQLLTQFRDSKRYESMKDLYDLRVRRNAKGNVDGRVHAFKAVFRSKLNNWNQKYEKSIKNP